MWNCVTCVPFDAVNVIVDVLDLEDSWRVKRVSDGVATIPKCCCREPEEEVVVVR